MAVNRERDMHTELVEGATDGSVMKLGGGMRGGVPSSLAFDADRRTWPEAAQMERHFPALPHIAP